MDFFMSTLVALLEILYGSMILAVALTYSCFQKEFWHARTTEEELDLQKASHDLWSLSNKDKYISHNFITTPNGTQMHFLASRATPKTQDTLIIFLHGFPDTAYLFSRQLRSAWAGKAHLVALDLPGCGGSDSLPSYGANEVLNLIASTIHELKNLFSMSGKSKPKCVLVGHDWGGVIGFRLAAETKGLIDDFVALNSIYPRYAANILKANVSRGGTLLSQGKLREAALELRPVFSQIQRSGYTYMLTLPIPLAKIMPGLSRCLVKLTHSLEYKHSSDRSPNALAHRLALAYGPSSQDCGKDKEINYGSSVLARSRTYPPGDWDQRVRLYSDGLLRGHWTPPLYALQGSMSRGDELPVPSSLKNSGSHQDHDDWQFQCPVSIIFGLQDVALDPRVAVDGIERHFMHDSSHFSTSSTMVEEKITRLSSCGHWSILEDEGSKALDRVLARIID